MSAIDRRTTLKGILLGTLFTAAAVASAGYIARPTESAAFPLAPLKANRPDLIERAQVVIVNPRRRRRLVAQGSAPMRLALGSSRGAGDASTISTLFFG